MCLANLLHEAHFASPEIFYLLPIFDNPLFKNGRRALKRCNFNNPEHKIEQVAHFYRTEGNLYTLVEINDRYGTRMTQAQLQSIHDAIVSGLAALNLNLGNCTWQPEPRQPTVVQIAARNIKGCRGFYNTFRSRANHRNLVRKFEQKWHEELGCNLSIDFWDKCWKLHASIKNNNRFKWTQCQILRSSIYTNNRVAKFKDNIRDICDLCGQHSERPLSLFFTCNVTQQFWTEIVNFFLNFSIAIPLSRLKILFGVLDEPPDSIINTAIMIGKQVIWACKFRKSQPNIIMFKRSLKDYLVLLSYCHSMNNTCISCNDQWGAVLRNLVQEDGQPDVPLNHQQGHHVPHHGQPGQQLSMHHLLWQDQDHQCPAQPPQHLLLQLPDDPPG